MIYEGSTGFRDQPNTKSVPKQDYQQVLPGQFTIQHQGLLLSLGQIITLLPGQSWKYKALLYFAACQGVIPLSI